MPFEALLRRYSEFRGSDGTARWARSVELMSESWVAKTLVRVERAWGAIATGGGGNGAGDRTRV